MNGTSPGRRDGPARARRWLAPLAGHRWYVALGAVAGVGLLAAGAIGISAALHGGPGSRRLTAADCGLVNCGAQLPASAIGGAASASAPGRTGRASPSTGSPTLSPSPAAHARPSPSQPAPAASTSGSPSPGTPGVTVSFTDYHKPHGQQGQQLRGKLTITNHGSTRLAGWTIRLTLPGDTISWVGQGGWSGLAFDSWHTSGDVLTLTAAASETISAGGTLQVAITGHGPTASPVSCTLNGVTCTP